VADDVVAELAADDPLAKAFSRALWLATLQGRHRCCYDVWADSRYHRDPRYTAQRLPGASCRPYAVVTTDPAELDAVLTHGSGDAR
jgi:hypothetical protein